MKLIELHCEGFRSLKTLHFKPEPGINIIRGHNAQGKTSLLEALLYLATSKSHRTTQESDLVSHSAQEFHLRCRVQRKDREVAVEAHWWRGVKRFKINGIPQVRLSDILGKINVVFFSPEDVGLIRGSAAQRRRFLDMELSQLDPAYLHALQQYRQVVRQRNELLRKGTPDPAMLDVWDEQLARHGEVLTRERALFLEKLAEPAAEAYAQIARGEALTLTHRPDVPKDADLKEVLTGARASDIRQGLTTRGPHRDDIEFLIEGKAARHFASQGQQRTAALGLKIAELELVRARTGEYPILMLDDVLSELDAQRSHRLLGAVGNRTQCLVTTTTLSGNETVFGADCAYFLLQKGSLIRQ